jgi:hypothetical protein
LATPIMLSLLGDAPVEGGARVRDRGLLAWRHRDNLARLAAGTERRLGGTRRG